jgi:uncharacterized membrane protein YbhN (UPF0104 family)
VPRPNIARGHSRRNARDTSGSEQQIWRWGRVAAAVLVVAGIFLYVLPRVASYEAAWRALDQLTAAELGGLVAITLLNIATYWPPMVAALPGLTLGQAAVNNQASTAVANSLPGGGAVAVAVSYGMFRSWGFDDTAIGLYALVTGIWNNFAKFGMPALALALLALEGHVRGALTLAAAAGVGAFVASVGLMLLVLWKPRFAKKIGDYLGAAVSGALRLFRRGPVEDWGAKAAGFRSRSIDLLSTRWWPLTVTTVVSHLGLYAVLLVALRSLGVSQAQVSWPQILGVYSFARLLSALPVTPGGLGVAELSYITGLVVVGCPRHIAVASVLLFRTLTYLLQIPLGVPAYLVWQHRKSWRRRGDEAVPRYDLFSTADR